MDDIFVAMPAAVNGMVRCVVCILCGAMVPMLGAETELEDSPPGAHIEFHRRLNART